MAGRNLEELVSNDIPTRVVMLEDNKNDIFLFLYHLNRLAKPNKYKAIGTMNPDEVYRLATQDTSIPVAVIDLFLKGTPPEMKTKFKNGLDVAKAIKEVRGDSIDVVLISGMGSITDEAERRGIEANLGEDYLESFSKSNYIDASWKKSGLLEDIEELFSIVEKSISKRQLMLPIFPRVYIIAGERGAGKNSSAGLLNKRMLYLYAVSPPTTKPILRPSEISNLTVPFLYRGIDHERLKPEEMRERIIAAENPLIWTEDGPIFSKDAYLKLDDSALRNQYFYMLEPDKLKKKINEGNDVLVLIRNVNALEALKRFFNELAYVIYLKAGQLTRDRRISEEGRPPSERLKLWQEESSKRYLDNADAVIKTELEFHPGHDLDKKQRRMDAIDHTSRRISEVIEHGRKTSYDVSPYEMHAEYVRNDEGALCVIAGCRDKLKIGSHVEIIENTREEYHRNNIKKGVDFLSLIPRISSARVIEISEANGVRRIQLAPIERFEVSLDARMERPWNDVLEGLIETYLKQVGYHPSQTRNIFPADESPNQKNIRNMLVYAETDAPPPLTKTGQEAALYRLELVFG